MSLVSDGTRKHAIQALSFSSLLMFLDKETMSDEFLAPRNPFKHQQYTVLPLVYYNIIMQDYDLRL